MNRTHKINLLTLLLLVIAAMTTVKVLAHGTMTYPPSRTWICFEEGPQTPKSTACQAAVAESGTQQLYEWDMINQLPAGDHQAFVPDGELCMGGKTKYEGMNLARDDWRKMSMVPDENGMSQFVFYASVPHPANNADTPQNIWEFYVTKDDWDPLQTLNWDTLEAEPFCASGEVPLTAGNYLVDCELPTDKEGYHIVYSIWQREDSPEAFYACSDVLLGAAALVPTPTPTPIPVAGECRSAGWSGVRAYMGGEIATHAGKEWRAKWPTMGDEPSVISSDGVTPWEEVIDCAAVITATPAPTDTPTVEPDPATETPTVTPESSPTPEPSPTATEEAGVPLPVQFAASDAPQSSFIWLLLVGIGAGLVATTTLLFARRR